jgi:hypothetical protein
MSDQTYVVITENEDFCVGTMDAITDWLYINDSPLGECTFYELGKKIDVVLEVVNKK